MNKEWEDVKLFHEKFGHPISKVPTIIEKKRVQIRGTWMLEEIAEFMTADDIYEQSDAMIDLIYFALGTIVEMGIEPDELFNIVQKANMDKLWEDGKPKYNNKDGKVLKPVNWEDPKPKIKEYIDKLSEKYKSD
jgi:predicted HAD superfamily Cof-like phosphohydrolase